jgi:hypothetical protein
MTAPCGTVHCRFLYSRPAALSRVRKAEELDFFNGEYADGSGMADSGADRESSAIR